MDEKSIRPSFLIYKSFYKPIKVLSNEDAGKLFKAIFEYHFGDFEVAEKQFKPEIRVAFEFIKNQFELDDEKYQKKIAAQTANGKKGGRPKKSNALDTIDKKTKKKKETHGFFGNPTKPKKAVKEKEKEKEKDIHEKSICKIRETSSQKALCFILDDLNKRLSLERGFSSEPEKTQKLIQARMNEGYSIEDFINVNQKKVKQWLNDPIMYKFLRPETLYGSKFEGYLNEIKTNEVTASSQKPKYQTADERRIENNRKIFNKALQETENGTE